MWKYMWKVKSVVLTNLYNYVQLIICVLKGDRMVTHHIGLKGLFTYGTVLHDSKVAHSWVI